MFVKSCEACKEEFQAWRKEQKLCKVCYKDMIRLSSKTKSSNQYIWVNGRNGKKYRHEHRLIAEALLQRDLHTNEVVHHLDDNPKNNQLTNLIVIDRRSHSTLHKYLDLQRVILEKSRNENFENCWNTLIVPMTTVWLETTSTKVIKLWEIGQPAAEPLTEQSYEEGSETMHETSATGNAVEDDIVQTTTALAG